jgi:hypothetical protein
VGNGEVQGAKNAQRLIRQTVDEIRRDRRLNVEQRLNLQEPRRTSLANVRTASWW